MSEDELKFLAEKVVKGEATDDEKLVFMKELNALLEELKDELKK